MELIAFKNFYHENEYIDYVENLSLEGNEEKAILYLLLLDSVCKQHMQEIYDFNSKRINTDVISKPWQTESSLKTTKLMFMITDDYPKMKNENIRSFSICSILKSEYTEYYLEALRIWLGTVNI